MTRKPMFKMMATTLLLGNLLLGFIVSTPIHLTDFTHENNAVNAELGNQSPSLNGNILGNTNIDNNNNSNNQSNISRDNNNNILNLSPDVPFSPATNGSFHQNEAASDVEPTTAGVKENVMSLSNDVIIDALFSNIDTLQDRVEVCEEALRYKLKSYSYAQLLKVPDNGADNDVDDELENQETDEATTELDIDDDSYDDDIAKLFAEGKVSLSFVKQQRRNRQFAVITDKVRHVPTFDEIAQNVVERLSSRMSYLRSSIVQCRSLLRQFSAVPV